MDTVFITVVTEFKENAEWESKDTIIGISKTKENGFLKGKPNDYFRVEEWGFGAHKPTRVFHYQNEHTIGAEGWWESVSK